MSKAPMELAINIKEGKTPFPAWVSKKFDGVPIAFKMIDGEIKCLTRQNKEVTSVSHLVEPLKPLLTVEGSFVIAECFIPNKPFKVSSGAIRKDAPNTNIVGRIFDAAIDAKINHGYCDRMNAVMERLENRYDICVASSRLANSIDDVIDIYEMLKEVDPDIEGVMVHDAYKPFQAGKRCWGMGRYKPQPTLDLEVVHFNEAIDKNGVPAGMVGSIQVLLQEEDGSRKIVKVGAGKMTHDERRDVWNNQENYLYQIIEVKHKGDSSYDDLREATFQRWRPDKTEPDIYYR